MLAIDSLLLLPILVPFVTAILAILSWRQRYLQRAFGIGGTVVLLVAAVLLFITIRANGPQAMQIGDWPAPFGITVVADLFSAIMVLLAGSLGFIVGLYTLVNIDAERQALGFYPLYHILLMGVCGAFLTGDLFNLYVWFEVVLIASFVLLALGSERHQLEGAFKYVTLNLMASALFLAATGILYGVAGTLNLADLSQRLPGAPTGLVTTLAMMFLVAFGIKAALFPLYSWLPAAYHTPPTAVSAIFAGLLTKVGVYAIVRTFTLLFTQDVDYTHTVILVMAGLTMVMAVLGAVSQGHFRRILSFHSASQIGYIVMGLAFFTPLGIAAAIYFIIHHSIVKTNLFLISGLVNWIGGSYQLKQLGGFYRSLPFVSALFLIPAFSLAGIPPFTGFWAKFGLVQAGLDARQYLIVAVSLAVSVLTLYSMVKIWTQAFWQPRAAGTERPLPRERAGWFFRLLPISILVLATILVGLAAEPVLGVTTAAAQDLLTPTRYVTAVLGG